MQCSGVGGKASGTGHHEKDAEDMQNGVVRL